MKILHVVESFGGGVYDFILNITKGLSKDEHFIIHGIRKNTPKNFEIEFPKNTKFLHWKSASREIDPIKDSKAFWELFFLLKRYHRNVDVIHLHSSKAGFIGRLVGKILGISHKILYTTHGVSFLRKDISKVEKILFIGLEKLGYHCGGKVISCSKSEAEELSKYGIKADYIYNGVEIPKYIHNKLKQANRIDKKLTIATMGRITAAKNPLLFNNIAKSFINNPNINFLWIGDGELRNLLTSPNIEITGWLNKEEALKVLSSIDIYLSTSLWEGLPLSVLYAMALKKPLILSNCVGNRDLVKPDYNGFLFTNEKEAISILKILINNSILRKYFGENSYLLYEKSFTLQKMIINYRRYYKRIKDEE